MKKLWCYFFGHRRGRRVTYLVGGPESDGVREYECPRCETTWTRKIRKAKA